jgi:hypothetical protein
MRRRGAQSCALALAGVLPLVHGSAIERTADDDFANHGKNHSGRPGLDRLIAQGASIEVLGSGFAWTEGPLWMNRGRVSPVL